MALPPLFETEDQLVSATYKITKTSKDRFDEIAKKAKRIGVKKLNVAPRLEKHLHQIYDEIEKGLHEQYGEKYPLDKRLQKKKTAKQEANNQNNNLNGKQPPPLPGGQGDFINDHNRERDQ